MPIYEYRCGACEREFEYMQRISDDPKSDCERCGGALERLISHTSFQLKGAGWYRDLYSSPKPEGEKGGESKNGESNKPADGKSDSGGAAKESKEAVPAAKADAKASTGDSKP